MLPVKLFCNATSVRPFDEFLYGFDTNEYSGHTPDGLLPLQCSTSVPVLRMFVHGPNYCLFKNECGSL